MKVLAAAVLLSLSGCAFNKAVTYVDGSEHTSQLWMCIRGQNDPENTMDCGDAKTVIEHTQTYQQEQEGQVEQFDGPTRM